MTQELQNWIQVAAIQLLLVMGVGRAVVLKRKRIQVVVQDPQVSKIRLLNGTIFFICLFTWIFESFSYSLAWGYHVPSPTMEAVVIHATGLKMLGVILLAGGLGIYALALYSFRDSWRIGLDRETPGPLVTTGIFQYSRNPIYISLELLAFGTFLLQGRLIFLILSIGMALSLHVEILHEEKYLMQLHGDSFLSYRFRVSRYFTIKRFFRYEPGS